MKTRILIADDHEMFRNGLKMLINRRVDMEVIGEADNGQEAISLANVLQPDIILMDVNMPVMDGVEATRRIHSAMPGMKILALSIYSDAVTNRAMLQAGALGYIVKGDDFEKLVDAIRNAAKSGRPGPSGMPSPSGTNDNMHQIA